MRRAEIRNQKTENLSGEINRALTLNYKLKDEAWLLILAWHANSDLILELVLYWNEESSNSILAENSV